MRKKNGGGVSSAMSADRSCRRCKLYKPRTWCGHVFSATSADQLVIAVHQSTEVVEPSELGVKRYYFVVREIVVASGVSRATRSPFEIS